MTVPVADRSSISSGERWVVVGGLGLAAASLVPWYRADEFAFGSDTTRTNGWQEPDAVLSIVATVAGALLAVLVLAVGRGNDRPAAGTGSWGTLLTGVSAVVLGLVALKFSLNTDNTTVGVYLALVAAATQLYGAYVTRIEEPAATRDPRPPPPPPPPPPPLRTTPQAPVATGQPLASSPPTQPTAPAGPTAVSPHPRWPETAYFLASWLRPGGDAATATAAYRRAFAGDIARQVRLTTEVRSLLDTGRPGAERAELIRQFAPHVRADQASVILGFVLQGLMGPPPP